MAIAKKKAAKRKNPKPATAKRVKATFGRWMKVSAVKVRKLPNGAIDMDFRPPGYRAPKKKAAPKKRATAKRRR